MTLTPVFHTSFVIEREFAAPRKSVFRAWSDAKAKQRWTACHPNSVKREHSLDFRPGGLELNRIFMPDGILRTVTARFMDIVTDQRIIYAYEMHVGEKCVSASLVTVVFESSGEGTKMTFTEQAAFLDGEQDRAERVHGTDEGFDRLAREALNLH